MGANFDFKFINITDSSQESITIDPQAPHKYMLCLACKYGIFKIAKYFIEECGIDPHLYNNFPLEIATENKQQEIIDYLSSFD